MHLYLSLIPEALIASMLSPKEFGSYYAVGSHSKQRGEAMFIELDPSFRNDFFRIDDGFERCVPHADGTPKKSVYISTYRVLEHISTEAFRKLYLVTAYGVVLGLDSDSNIPESTENLHLYQEIAPVQPLVVSTKSPQSFYEMITHDPSSLIHLPAIAFVELELGELATDPEFGAVRDLPYSNINHLRECLISLNDKEVQNKMVNRVGSVVFQYRTIKNGIFVGNPDALVYYPFPSREELRSTYYRWWQSANANQY
ncbi:MAG TPA: hypothetical protein PKE64_22160 [Anaerolineae bacterium]|nr:hypothetical protein [Anaerolineae bacterium]HMR66725.1 hypothetical protein [Anaerolineae bacterium]